MMHGLRGHAREDRENIEGLIEQAFRTLSVLTVVLVLVALGYAVIYSKM
jgi:hypothetical protein